MQKYKWKIKAQPSFEEIKDLSRQINTPYALSTVLLQRGINTFEKAKSYFRPKFDDLCNPFLMKDMKIAAERLYKAIEKGQRILVYGDYDVDGTTSVAMMTGFLSQFNDNVSYYIPDRYSEGYGVSETGIAYALDNDFDLLITLDCGIKASGVFRGIKNQLDTIVCDHHLPGEELPEVMAILDPKRVDCLYPYKELSGCGVGFKLIQATSQVLGIEKESLQVWLDYVAISIAADIVPITGENRVLASLGLEMINRCPRPGISAMVSPDSIGHLKTEDLVFGMAPKINAAGRIKHARSAVELLMSQDVNKAKESLIVVSEQNETRKSLDKQAHLEALEMLKDTKELSTNIVYSPNWQKGILGIVASRIIETYYKPTIVFTKSKKDELVASARSVAGFNIYEALCDCEDLLTQFGGHTQAAGLSLQEKNLDVFKKRFNDLVESRISIQQKTPHLEIENYINFNEITDKFVRIHEQMAPFGPKNMTPIFLARNVMLTETPKKMGKDKSHLRLNLMQKNSQISFEAVAFKKSHLCKPLQSPFDMAFQIKINYWKGKSKIQLILEDARPATSL